MLLEGRLVYNLIFAVEKEADKARLDAEAEARRTARSQKAQRQRERESGVDTRGDDDLEARPNAVVRAHCPFYS